MLEREARFNVSPKQNGADGVFSLWKGAVIIAPPGTGKTTFARKQSGRIKVYDGDELTARIGPWPEGDRLADDDQLRNAYAYTSIFAAAAQVTKDVCIVLAYPPPIVWPQSAQTWLYVVQPDADLLAERRSSRDGDASTDDLDLYNKVGPRHYTTIEEAYAAAIAAITP